MAYLLPHLHSGYAVDQAILNENDRIVVLRFGRDWVPECMMMDKTLSRIAELVKNFAVVYLVDLDEVPDFNKVSNNLNIFYRRCKISVFNNNYNQAINTYYFWNYSNC
jgi:DIM1 family U5 snRNP protein